MPPPIRRQQEAGWRAAETTAVSSLLFPSVLREAESPADCEDFHTHSKSSHLLWKRGHRFFNRWVERLTWLPYSLRCVSFHWFHWLSRRLWSRRARAEAASSISTDSRHNILEKRCSFYWKAASCGHMITRQHISHSCSPQLLLLVCPSLKPQPGADPKPSRTSEAAGGNWVLPPSSSGNTEAALTHSSVC